MACRRSHPIARRRGMTFLELSISLAVIGMIAGATAAVASAMGQGWRATDTNLSLRMSGQRASTQLDRLLHTARRVGLATDDGTVVDNDGIIQQEPGAGAALMLWEGSDPLQEDLALAASEVVLVEHNIPNRTLVLYELGPTATDTAWSVDELQFSTGARTFKELAGITSRVIAAGVVEVSLRSRREAGRQAVEYVLRLEDGGVERTEYGTAWLRAPALREGEQ